MAGDNTDTVDIWNLTKGIQKMLEEHTKIMIAQYKTINGIYRWPNKVFMETIMSYWPEGTNMFFKEFETWFENEMQTFENKFGESTKAYADNISEIKSITPDTDLYRTFVGEYTKLWIEGYIKCTEQRDRLCIEWLGSMKKMFPLPIHPMLEYSTKWMIEQNEIIDNVIIEQMKKIGTDIISYGK